MPVKQISNLFELMDFFVRAKKPLSVREIVEEFSWPRSSVFNMVSTMVACGYLYQPVPRGGYWPTTRWMDLARELSGGEPLPESVHKLLVEIMNRTGETLAIASAEGTSVVLLDVVEPPAVIRYTASVGQRLPIHVTAAGRAILAQYSASERAAVLERIKYQRSVKNAFRTAAAVEREIHQGAENGWHVNLANYAHDLAGVAVPFPFRGHRYAIVLGGPVPRVEQRVDTLGRLLRESVRRFLKENAG